MNKKKKNSSGRQRTIAAAQAWHAARRAQNAVKPGPLPTEKQLAWDRSRKKLSYPFACRKCGGVVERATQRFWNLALCRECGLAKHRETQEKVAARKRGEAVPFRMSQGAAPREFPFPCRDCSDAVRSEKDRYTRTLRCRPCGLTEMKDQALRRKYGLSLTRLAEMKKACRNSCEICRGDGGVRGLMVDHDHKTGAVRGLLCIGCNLVLGSARDNTKTLLAAIAYLKRTK